MFQLFIVCNVGCAIFFVASLCKVTCMYRWWQ